VTTIVDTQLIIPDDTKVRKAGTNNVAAKTFSKSVRQNVTITLIEATPIQEPASRGRRWESNQ